jgi:G3E family GTPase
MGFSLARDAEASDVLMLNKDDILSDRFERKMRNLNQLRRSSVVSGMKVSHSLSLSLTLFAPSSLSSAAAALRAALSPLHLRPNLAPHAHAHSHAHARMQELWMEDLPHPQRSGSAAPWESREMPTGALMMASVCVRVSG